MAAAKAIHRICVEHYRQTGEHLSPEQVAEEHDLWIADEWTHVGHCILTCLENPKLIENYRKGNPKILDVLVGKTLKSANMTVDPALVRELMPLIIERHWP